MDSSTMQSGTDPVYEERNLRPAADSSFTLEPYTPGDNAEVRSEQVLQEKYANDNTKNTEGSEWSQVQQKSRKNQSRNNRYTTRLFQSSDYETTYYVKYFTIKFPGKNIETDIDVIQTDRDLLKHIGKPEKIIKAGFNSLHVATMSQGQSDKLMNLKTLAGIKIIVEPHRQLNTVKGVVRSKSFNNSTIEALEEKLKIHGVTQVRRITKKLGETKIKTDTYILLFNRQNRPNSLKITDWHSVKVEEYKEKPRQCYNCQKFGHVSKYCRKLTPTCSRCSIDGHTMKECESLLTECYNCRGHHISTNRVCKFYQIEEEILATMGKECVPKYNARQLVLERTPQYGKLYSEAIKRTKIQTTRSTYTDKDEGTNSNPLTVTPIVTQVITAEVHHSHSSQIIKGKPKKKTSDIEQTSFDDTDKQRENHRKSSLTYDTIRYSPEKAQDTRNNQRSDKNRNPRRSNSLERIHIYNPSEPTEQLSKDNSTTKRKRNISSSPTKYKLYKIDDSNSKNKNYAQNIPVINR